MGDPSSWIAIPASGVLPRRLDRRHSAARRSRAELVLRATSGSNLFRLSGTLPLGGEPWPLTVALDDPARYAATVFAEVLAAQGHPGDGAVATSSDPLPAGMRVLAARESEPMSEILKVVNKRSQNLHTEMLLRLLGAQVKGEGTVEAGHEAVADFLRRLDVPTESWDLRDASGLSPVGRGDAAGHGRAARGHGPAPARGRVPRQPARGRRGRHARGRA